jgi:hypothetical protein
VTKLLPVTVKVKAEPPAVAFTGLIEVIVGTGFCGGFIVNILLFEVRPESALYTVTVADPADAISVAVIDAVS